MDPPTDSQKIVDPVSDNKASEMKVVELNDTTSSPVAKSGQSNSDLTIAFKNVSYSVQVPVASDSYETFISPFVNTVKAIATCGKSSATRTFYRAREVSGVVKQGTMKLVIAPPGHGKSTYLKLLSHRLPTQSGKLVYNGRTIDEARAEGCDLKKMTQYVDQVDTHLPLLTVTETLDFAHKVSSHKYDPERVASTIALLGLDECKDTILGNALIRGVSGGQKRRVTLGEMLVSDARVLFLDEFTNGLDTATSEDIASGLRKWCDETHGSIVSTLQQPTPGLYNTFDDIVILREGQVVFDGPREDVLPFFEAMGYRCPGDVDVCDFLIDVLSQPRLSIQRQQDNDKKDVKAGKTVPAPNLKATFGSDFVVPAKPCVSTQDMVDYYHSSPLWKDIKKDLDVFFPETGAADASKFAPLMSDETAKLMYGVGYIMSAMSLFMLVLSRQVKMVFRDKALVGPRIFNMILMGLVLGSMYYKIGLESFFLRCAVLLLSVAQIAFGSMVELPIAVAASSVVFKQTGGAGFYPTWAYVISAAVTMIPLMIGEVTIFSNILYWMADNVPTADAFFTSFAICLVTAFCMSIWFRMLSAVGKDEASAHALAGPSTGVFMIFGGFFVNEQSMPVFMRWIFWISPFSWATRALVNNEFLSSRYDATTDDGTRLGDSYINTLDFDIGYEWVGYAVLYLIGLSLFLMAVHTLVLNKPYHEHSIGTRRTDDEELVESEMDTEGEGAIKLTMTAAVEAETEPEADGALERQESSASLVRDASSFNQNTLKTLREELPFHPTWLSFSDVKYTVQIQVDGQTKDKVLLDGVSGYAEPGKLTALMGASGAGKTTLLDVLAGRKTSGAIEGTIMLNGRAPTPTDFANVTGYVEQFDSLLAFDTVRETLQFAARLRLPASVSEEVKEKIVDEILEILDLSSMQGYLIGNESVPGLSPSQLKRVNIGVELVANPSVLFLDEPTTGLDSKAAQTVMRVVRRIARSGRSVVCTIHQPSAELFYLFDRLVLLGSGGHQIYFGDLGNRSAKFVKYLTSAPGVKPIPARYNPASWMLEELGVGVASAKTDGTPDDGPVESQAEIVQRFKAFYFKSRVFRHVAARLKALETLSGEDASIEYSVSRSQLGERSYSVSLMSAALPTAASTIEQKDAPSMWYQYKLLQYRSFASYWRNPPFLFMRMRVLLILSILFGLIYLGIEVTSQSRVISGVAGRVMPTVFGGFVMASTALPTFLNNREVFYRERASSMYAPGLWAVIGFVTECLVWVPICAIVMQIPAYFMIEMKNTAGAFFQYYLALVMTFIVFISISSLIAAVAPTAPAAGIIQSSAFGLFINLNGVAITAPSIPIGWNWVFRMLPLSHATMALLREQFAGNNDLIEIASGTTTYSTTVSAYVAEYMGFGYKGYWTDIGWIVLFVVVVQGLSFYATKNFIFSTR